MTKVEFLGFYNDPMLNLRITHDRAIGELRRIPHKTFQDGITTHWVVDANGNVQGQSVCWLFCWGKTGRGSEDAASAARQAFDAILDLPFTAFDSRVPHEWARWARYTREDVEPQLIAYLNDLLTESIEIAYSRSQGIQLTPEIRRAIELHAMDGARRHYEARGFDVHDHSRSWPYDLECVSEHRSVFVEVKGTQTLAKHI